MVANMDKHAAVSVGWCNQIIWRQTEENRWLDTGKLVTAQTAQTAHLETQLIRWGHPRQAFGALHSHGAMLLRTSRSRSYVTPEDIPVGGIEPFRERLFQHPMLFIQEPLANFSVTIVSAQSKDRVAWGAFQTVLVATYFRNANTTQRADLVSHAIQSNCLSPLLMAGLVDASCAPVFSTIPVRLRSRCIFRWMVRPLTFLKIRNVRHAHPDWWTQLDEATKRQFQLATSDPAN